MIRQATPDDEPALLAVVRRAPCIGARMEVDWHLAAQNPKMPYLFYMLDGPAVLEETPRGVVLCGKPKYRKEAELFLQSIRAARMTTDGWCPAGWSKSGYCLMRWKKSEIAARIPPGFDEAPGMERVLEVLESTDGRIIPEGVRSHFYADICARRNHGYAEVYGIWAEDVLASTAGVYTITGWEAYIACVETRPDHRGRGYASALVRLLCARFADRPVTLMCEPNMKPFYRALGFKTIWGARALTAQRVGGGAR